MWTLYETRAVGLWLGHLECQRSNENALQIVNEFYNYMRVACKSCLTCLPMRFVYRPLHRDPAAPKPLQTHTAHVRKRATSDCIICSHFERRDWRSLIVFCWLVCLYACFFYFVFFKGFRWPVSGKNPHVNNHTLAYSLKK